MWNFLKSIFGFGENTDQQEGEEVKYKFSYKLVCLPTDHSNEKISDILTEFGKDDWYLVDSDLPTNKFLLAKAREARPIHTVWQR